ncbi:pyroglutamyl-peptidase I [Motilimonas eburnea]|uniref:pyroglutamyl-peptidase I n=1 Tax=Motilimonas eburnea TaxID=1737488 RepID=UPI001E4017F4|nr:pyroglutamyl-peptidase I [Motilimonas eburnea]MCE2570211.1 pyroglutamyl-peptidase I [Motilimonas eburnea]
MKSILVAGFEPFNGQSVNPASEVLPLLANTSLTNAVVHCQTLPVIGAAAHEKLMTYIEQYQADIVLVLGQAAGRDKLTLERVAINVDDYPIKDNAGEQPLDQPIVRHGPAAYFTTLPIKSMTHAMNNANVPSAISNTAGTFVCNHIFYRTLHSLATELTTRKVVMGFMHLPLLPEQAQAQQFAMPLSEQLAGVQASLTAALAPTESVAMVTGSQC